MLLFGEEFGGGVHQGVHNSLVPSRVCDFLYQKPVSYPELVFFADVRQHGGSLVILERAGVGGRGGEVGGELRGAEELGREHVGHGYY